MTPNRRFLYEALGMGVELGCITPEDLIQHITPEVLAHHLPVALKARLLQASLDAERLTPAVIVQAVGIEALVEHSPMPALWACVRTAAERQVGAAPERHSPERHAPGNGAITPTGDDLALKPPKSARGVIQRSSSRVSSLSPRSRVIRREDTGNGLWRDDSMVRDFEVVDETDVRRPTGSPAAPILSPGDEETRPGPKS